MKDLIENCWSTKPQALPVHVGVPILTEYRKRCLHLELDQECAEGHEDPGASCSP